MVSLPQNTSSGHNESASYNCFEPNIQQSSQHYQQQQKLQSPKHCTNEISNHVLVHETSNNSADNDCDFTQEPLTSPKTVFQATKVETRTPSAIPRPIFIPRLSNTSKSKTINETLVSQLNHTQLQSPKSYDCSTNGDSALDVGPSKSIPDSTYSSFVNPSTNGQTKIRFRALSRASSSLSKDRFMSEC